MAAAAPRSTKYYLNRIHTLVELVLRRASPTNVPIYCFHEPTTGCNLRCPACPTGTGAANVKETATLEDYEQVCREFGSYLDVYYLYNWGEPTMAKAFLAIVNRLRTEPFLVRLSTNFAVPLKDEVITALATMPNLDLRIAIDGVTQETYAQYRINAKLSTVLDNARRLSQVIKASSTPPRQVYFAFLAFDHNAHEGAAVKNLASELGFRFHREDNPLVADESLPSLPIKLEPAFGCTWLYSSICPSPKLSKIAPCCGIWDGEMMSTALPGKSLHESFMQEPLYMQRRQADAAFTLQPAAAREAQLQENTRHETGMALGQKNGTTDACARCTMGVSYQNKLMVLVDGAVESLAMLLKMSPDTARNRLYTALPRLLPGPDQDAAMRERLDRVLDMPPVSARSIKHYEGFVQFLAQLGTSAA